MERTLPPKTDQIEPCDDFEEFLLEDYDETRHSTQKSKPRRTVTTEEILK